jgi:hypothetical protein
MGVLTAGGAFSIVRAGKVSREMRVKFRALQDLNRTAAKPMRSRTLDQILIAAAALAVSAAHATLPAPTFEVAYHAWEIVNELSRHNRKPELTGQCGKTFRAVAVPALRKQTREEQDAAAGACVKAAREACADANLQRTQEMAARCQEFR